MRSLKLSSLLALVGTGLAAHDAEQAGPFALKITDSANSTINNARLYACHAGAAIEGLCIDPKDVKFASPFYLNYTGFNTIADGSEAGTLIWNLLLADNTSVSSSMDFSYTPNSNLAVPLFTPGSVSTTVGFDKKGKLFVYTNFDDSTFVAMVRPNATGSYALYNWHACWNFVGSYYYHTVSWLTSGKPHNPTCTPVNVTRVKI